MPTKLVLSAFGIDSRGGTIIVAALKTHQSTRPVGNANDWDVRSFGGDFLHANGELHNGNPTQWSVTLDVNSSTMTIHAGETNYADLGGYSNAYAEVIVAALGGGYDVWTSANFDLAPPLNPPSSPTITVGTSPLLITPGWTNAGDVTNVSAVRLRRYTANTSPLPVYIDTPYSGQTTQADTTFSQIVPYYYTISYISADGAESTSTSVVSGTPIPPVPAIPSNVILTPVDSTATFNLTWNVTPYATSYQVFRTTTSGSYNLSAPLATVSTNVCNDATGTVSTEYYYVVRAVNSSGAGTVSSEVHNHLIGIPPAPALSAESDLANNTVSLSWTISDATFVSSYNIYRDGNLVTNVGSGVSTYADTPGNRSIHAYSIRALNSRSENGALSSGYVNGISNIAGVLSSVVPANNSVTVNYVLNSALASMGTTFTIKVQRSLTGTGSWTDLSDLTSYVGLNQSYADNTAVNGTLYYYRIRIDYDDSPLITGVPSSVLSATPNPPPDPPTSLAATQAVNSITLGWTAPAAGASVTGYHVYRRGSLTGSYSLIGTVTSGTAFTDDATDLLGVFADWTTYYYVVRAYNSIGDGANSNEVNQQGAGLPLNPLSAPTGTAGNLQNTLHWLSIPGADSYTLARATVSGGSYTDISAATNLAALTFVDTGLTNDTAYYYVYRGHNTYGDSAPSSQTALTPRPPSPGIPTSLTATTNVSGQINLAWNAPSSAYTYNVLRGTASGGAYTSIASGVSGTTYSDTPPLNWTNYYYVVQAVNTTGVSANSNEAQGKAVGIPFIPQNVRATGGNANAVINWNASLGADSYTLKRALSAGGSYSIVASGLTSLSYIQHGLTNGTDYYYTVSAHNSYGDSAESSPPAHAHPSSPPVSPVLRIVPGSVGDETFALAWPSITGAASYSFYIASAQGAQDEPATITGITTSPNTFVSYPNFATLYIKARAINANGTPSGYSNEVVVTPVGAPRIPTNLQAVGEDSLVVLSWSSSPGAKTYNILRDGSVLVAGLADTGAFSMSYLDQGLTNGQTYHYQVQAVNPSYTSKAYSASVAATPVAGNSASGLSVVYNARLYGLPPRIPEAQKDVISVRHFEKATAGAVYSKPLLGQYLISGYTDLKDFGFAASDTKMRVFAMRITPQTTGAFYDTQVPRLLEIKLRSRSGAVPPRRPRIRFAADASDFSTPSAPVYAVGSDLSGWVEAVFTPPVAGVGRMAPYNELVQFDISGAAVTLAAGTAVWLAVEVPAGCELAQANGLSNTASQELFTYSDNTTLLPDVAWDGANPIPGTGWVFVTSIWHKLFVKYRARHDNVVHGAYQQARMWADNHAHYQARSYTPMLSQSSALSTPVKVDITPPDSYTLTGGIAGRPLVTATLPPALRNVMLTIQATDADTLPYAFRVGRESDGGSVVFTPWQPWNLFCTDSPTNQNVQYTTYLYGTRLVDETGSVDPTGLLLGQPTGSDGPRKLWVQAMDAVGNISESFPVTLLAQDIAIVDTVAPTALVQFVDPLGTGAIKATNEESAFLNVTTSDRVTAVKDIRIRPVGLASSWGEWQQPSLYTPYDLDARDGLKRIEVQARDYGNNAQQQCLLWDTLYDVSLLNTLAGLPTSSYIQRSVIFIASVSWTPPNAEEAVYLSGILSQSFARLTLLDSSDPAYSGSTAFFVVGDGTDPAMIGRRVLLRATDRISMTVNGSAWTNFAIDVDRGLLIMTATLPSAPTISVVLKRDSAMLYRWNASAVEAVEDLGYYGERAILSMASASNGIYLGGGSGNIWFYDGNAVTGPVTTLASGGTGLPVRVLHLHQFPHETEPYLYAGTGNVPRLYRAAASTALVGASWLPVAASGFLAGSSGDILSAASAYGKLFLGTASAQVLSYLRVVTAFNPLTNIITETETVTSLPILNSEVGRQEGTPLAVTSLNASAGALWAGIGDRPEVHCYVESWVDNPVKPETWSLELFDRGFVNDPQPWQYYNHAAGTADSLTTTRNSPRVSWVAITDPNTELGFRDMMLLGAATGEITSFTLDTGSDWEQAMSNSPTQWTLEFDMMNISGSGSQGFEIADSRYFLSVQVDLNKITLQSGSNSISALWRADPVIAFDATDSLSSVYPVRGVKKIWDFAGNVGGAPSQEDRGPYWIGNNDSVLSDVSTDFQGWQASDFVQSISLANETEADTASFTAKTRFLKVLPARSGNPEIKWTGDPVPLDSECALYIRIRANMLSSQTDLNAKLRVGWSPTAQIDDGFKGWIETPIVQSGQFVTYRLTPSWYGQMQSLVIEIDGLPPVDPAIADAAIPTFDVDYIAIASDAALTHLKDNLTPVRIAVNGTRVQAWVGRNEYPLIDQPSFLLLPASVSRIRFGKLDALAAGSTWGWGGLRFLTGQSLAPVTRKAEPFRLFWRFPSAGGVHVLVNHLGTLWALTDGWRSFFRSSDNPDDHAAKAFSYVPDVQLWKQEDPPWPRPLPTNTIIVRPFTATSFQNTLVVGVQHGTAS